jgi:hypothetical protein
VEAKVRRLLVASIVLLAAGCGSDQPPPPPATRWSAAQAVGPPFEVAPFYVTIHSPARLIFTPPRVTWTGGTAVAVWSDVWRRIWAAQLGSTGGWTPPASIASPNRVPQAASSCAPFPCTGRPPLNEEAALVAVPGGSQASWEQTAYTDGPGIWSAASPPGGAWSAPQGQYPLPPGSVQGPVAKSAASHAIVAWQFTSNEDSTIWAQRYRDGAPQDAATRLRSGDRVFLRPPAVDIDAAGTAVLVWSDLASVHARWFSVAGGWGPDRMLPRANVDCPVVALDGTGGAIAAWREVVNFELLSDAWVTVTRLRPDTGWQAPESYSAPASRSGCPAIASSSSGLAILVWPNAGTSPGLWARPLGGSAAGTSARKIEDVDAAHEITSLRVAMDGGGNGYAAWIRARTDTSLTGTYSVRPPSGAVRASHFVNGGASWEAPEALQGPSSSQSDVATMVDIAVAADGSALAFWFEFENNMFTPWAARAVGR